MVGRGAVIKLKRFASPDLFTFGPSKCQRRRVFLTEFLVTLPSATFYILMLLLQKRFVVGDATPSQKVEFVA